ncbi:MAG: DinB family protein [Acidobacteria bacterium]|nr:DinB family protein [Acidobacteriota bacterium]
MPQFLSLLDETLESWQGVREGLIDEVENIPAGRFDFRPGPEMRSVAEIIQHLLEVSLMMTGELCRPDTDFHREPWPQLLQRYAPHVRRARTKQALVRLLRSSLDESQRKFRRVGEIVMLQLITRFDGRQGTRLAWLHHGIGHEMYHTGQLTAYERALGIVPALTRKIES